jgi:hypothetical protein
MWACGGRARWVECLGALLEGRFLGSVLWPEACASVERRCVHAAGRAALCCPWQSCLTDSLGGQPRPCASLQLERAAHAQGAEHPQAPIRDFVAAAGSGGRDGNGIAALLASRGFPTASGSMTIIHTDPTGELPAAFARRGACSFEGLSKWEVQAPWSVPSAHAAFCLSPRRCNMPGSVSERWLVSNAIAGGRARQLAAAAEHEGRGLLPWVGVAARLPEASQLGEASGVGGAPTSLSGPGAPADADDGRLALEGRAFCFLPLPIRTGLPVHVNAYFELSSNRREIW